MNVQPSVEIGRRSSTSRILRENAIFKRRQTLGSFEMSSGFTKSLETSASRLRGPDRNSRRYRSAHIRLLFALSLLQNEGSISQRSENRFPSDVQSPAKERSTHAPIFRSARHLFLNHLLVIRRVPDSLLPAASLREQ